MTVHQQGNRAAKNGTLIIGGGGAFGADALRFTFASLATFNRTLNSTSTAAKATATSATSCGTPRVSC